MRINNVQIAIIVVAFHRGNSIKASAQITANPIFATRIVIIALFIFFTVAKLYRGRELCASGYFLFFLLLQ